jgi:hypothetical protein
VTIGSTTLSDLDRQLAPRRLKTTPSVLATIRMSWASDQLSM